MIVEALDERDLDFSLVYHRFLWQQILDAQNQAIDSTALLNLLQDSCPDDKVALLYPLFQLDEKAQRDVLRGPLVIRAAVACLEQVMCEKRYRHFKDLWKQTDCIQSPDLAQYYQQQMYAEKQRIRELEQEQRRVSFADLAGMPWVGDFSVGETIDV